MEKHSYTVGDAVQIADIKRNKLYVDTDAFDKIMDKVGPYSMSVVSVNGPMRAGKSYILNYFIKYLSDPENDNWFTKKLYKRFSWKNSVDRQTTGILMWSEPLFITRNGKKVAILLMDTQGCFDENTTNQENSAIFALSCLLSSVLIYNVKNRLNVDNFENLHMFIGYARIAKESDQSELNDSGSFSKLIFLIRDWECPNDFNFGYYDDVTSPDLKNFKKEKIDSNTGMHPENITVRDAILRSFENVGCCLMPHPGTNLARYDIEKHLDRDFIKTIKDFVPRIFNTSNLCLKKMNGQEINGDDFKEIVHKWAKCFKEYDFPEVSNLAEASAEFHNQKAHLIALLHYREKMNIVLKGKGLSEENFENVHKENKKEALTAFNRAPRISNDDIKNRYMQELESQIQGAYTVYQEMNSVIRIANESSHKSDAELKQLKEEVDKKIKQLERSHAYQIRTITKKSEYVTIKFINEIDGDISINWAHHFYGFRDISKIESKVTKTFSFKNYDNLFWRTSYRATLFYNDKKANFCAFGENTPRENNIFTVKPDGIFLSEHKHCNWESNTSSLYSVAKSVLPKRWTTVK